ncbi:hypothetical protein [Sporosarcina koreensis]|uniref:phage scaffolding protein n=1 Tax=Sporosarcina koreensis TaxID=334735 RepID=UPI0007521D02|nr:hypothetical protein [Sporosarcina koreensis]
MTKLNELLALDLQFFADNGPAPVDPADSTPDPVEPQKAISQAELNEIIEKRLARERAKFADYDDLKAKAEAFEEEKARIEREKLSEAERLQADLAAEQKAKEELAAQLTSMQEQAEKERIQAAFVRKASEAGIKYTDAAVKLSDLSALKFNDDGDLDGIDSVINALITDNPFLVVSEPKKPKIIGGGTLGGDEPVEKTNDQLLEEARIKAQKSGLPKDRAAYAKLKRELGL